MSEQDKEKKAKGFPKTAIKILFGVLLIILGLLAVISWRQSLVMVFKGCIGLILIMAGAIAIAISRE